MVGELENKISEKATDQAYGVVKLSDASSVTKSEGLALPTSEKNPGINDTLANQILKQKENIDKLPFGEKWIPYGRPESLEDVTKMTGSNGICGFDIPSLFAPNEMMNMFSICHVHTFGAVRILELVGTDQGSSKIAVGTQVNDSWLGWKMLI